jgi:hypothetical protein
MRHLVSDDVSKTHQCIHSKTKRVSLTVSQGPVHKDLLDILTSLFLAHSNLERARHSQKRQKRGEERRKL